MLAIRPGPIKTNLYNDVESAPDFNIKVLIDSSGKMQLLPKNVASVFVRVIRRKKRGIIYPNFGTKIMVILMKRKFFAKLLMKGMDYMTTKIKSRTE